MAEKRQMPPSKRGYNMYEVVSAYQKAIRRSTVDDAIYWGAEGFDSGFAAWMWKRLAIIVSEDIGPAAPGLPADFAALRQIDGKMAFVHATMAAALAPKCRVVDWALFASADTNKAPDRDVPDEALDMHTLRGKQMGRGAQHFVDEGGRLIQPTNVAWTLSELEKRYKAVFCSDKSRWRDAPDEPEQPAGTKPRMLP